MSASRETLCDASVKCDSFVTSVSLSFGE